MPETALVRPGSVVLDCPDPAALAAFYAALMELPAAELSESGHWATLTVPGSDVLIEFQRAADYQAPTWPDPARPQMFHLDLRVDDMAAAAAHAISVGAIELDASDEHPSFRVYADPAGHPFCLCLC
jgi:catechol 2,3-dioxygenase-like lactoylglutathione lyase family enzyme